MTENVKKWTQISINKKDTKGKNTGRAIFSYASWQVAWKLLMETYPDARITVINRKDENGNILEFHGNESIGYSVLVRLEIPEINFDFTERLAILDNTNKPQKLESHTIKGKTVEGFLMDDVCNTIQRCTVKVIARAGIGLNVFEGDFSDIKEAEDDKTTQTNTSQQPKPAPQQQKAPVKQEQSKPVQSKITPDQVTKLQTLMDEVGVDVEAVCKQRNLNSLADLTQEQWKNAMKGYQEKAQEIHEQN